MSRMQEEIKQAWAGLAWLSRPYALRWPIELFVRFVALIHLVQQARPGLGISASPLYIFFSLRLLAL